MTRDPRHSVITAASPPCRARTRHRSGPTWRCRWPPWCVWMPYAAIGRWSPNSAATQPACCVPRRSRAPRSISLLVWSASRPSSRLLERSADDLACPEFGLRLAERQDIGILGPLAVAMRSAPTLGEAMRCAAKYIYVYNGAIGFSVRTDGDRALLTFDVLAEHDRHCAQTIEHGVGIAWRIVRMLSAERSHLKQVWLPHPPVATRAVYRRHLVAPVEFNARLAAIAIDRSDLDLALGEHNEELRALAVDYLSVRFPARATSVAAQVRAVIERLLGTGECSYTQVADVRLDAPVHPPTTPPPGAQHVRSHQGRCPTRSDRAVPGLRRRALHADHRPARLPGAVCAHPELSALVPPNTSRTSRGLSAGSAPARTASPAAI